MSQAEIILKAKQFIKSHKHEIIQLFAADKICPPETNPISIFMAGAMGAGKTEFRLNTLNFKHHPVIIDLDNIRELLPEYNGKNSSILNYPASIGLEYLHTHCLKYNKSFIFDSSFSNNIKKLNLNIQRSLKRKRKVIIYFVYQEPQLSWQFTQARTLKNNRVVSKDTFIKSFLNSYWNVIKIKKKFKTEIKLHLVTKKSNPKEYNIQLIDNLEKILPFSYNKNTLNKII